MSDPYSIQSTGRLGGSLGGRSRVVSSVSPVHRQKFTYPDTSSPGPPPALAYITFEGPTGATDFTFDNTLGGFTLIFVAMALRGGAKTYTAPTGTTVLYDTVSADEADFREVFLVLAAPPLSSLTWTLTATDSTYFAILSNGRLGPYSINHGYGADPAPVWTGVTLPDSNDDLFAMLVSRGNTSWLTDPSGLGRLGSSYGTAPATATALIAIPARGAGATGDYSGPDPDGGRSWASLLVGVRPPL